jgi:alpha-L-rhamnosidase
VDHPVKEIEQHRSRRLASTLLILVCLLAIASSLAYAGGSNSPVLYLPLILRNLPIQFDAPIWAHNTTPAQHEVVLFRRSFRLSRSIDVAELEIFADTRYEAWLDGVWLGRGPARFSQTLREYDTLPLGTLTPGDYSIAVLVQWAPNIRRSESSSPMLIAHLQGRTESGLATLLQTGSDWKVNLTGAWKADAQLVDTRFLIGPTELLDFHHLPINWNQPGYDDGNWAPAVTRTSVVQQSQPVTYAPRTILPLENVPAPVNVLDAGLLSPGFLIGELVPPVTDPYILRFSTAQTLDWIIETLSAQAPEAGLFQVDGQNLIWAAAGVARPDVYRATIRLSASNHRLVISAIPVGGLTFSVSRSGVTYRDFPFQQGRHAGRRMLLAEPISNPGQVQAIETSDGWSLEFNTLPAYVVLDLGRTVHGRIIADVRGMDGSVVDVGWDERLRTSNGRPLPYPGSMYPEWNQVDSWTLDGLNHQLTTLDARAGRYILIAVWGQGPVRMDNLRVEEERYPLVQVGEFHSSDPQLDRIWQVGVDSLRPNMTDALTDTPWRERGQWWGDVFVEDRAGRIAFGDTALLRRGLIYLADAMTKDPSPGKAPNNGGLHMLDYTMLWVHTLASELDATHDVDLARRLYPLVERFMAHLQGFENPQSRLLDLPKLHWSSTAYIDLLGFESRSGQSTALNALYVQTFFEAARIADWVGDTDQAASWRTSAAALQASLNTRLYLPLEGHYLSSIYDGLPVPPTVHAQAWPLAYNLAPEGEEPRVVEAMLGLLSPQPANANLGIYGMYWLLEALGQTGDIDAALQIIRLYYGFLLDAGATTWWESFSAESRPDASFSHGWGGAPTWFLTTYVLGAQRLGPDTWQVKPAFEVVDSASGVLPLAAGVLEVEWERVSCGEIHLRVRAADGSHGWVVVPYDHPDLSLEVDGIPAWGNGAARTDRVIARDTEIILELNGGGPHEFVGRYPCLP